MHNYNVKLTRDEVLSIIAGLQRELDFQIEQSATYRRNASLDHFAAYHNRLKKRADTLIDKLLALPGMAEANNQALLDSVGREPEFIIAVALKAMNDEEKSEANQKQDQYCTVSGETEIIGK